MENYELVADLIYAMLENFIYDITDAGIKNCFDKVRRRRFLKSLDVEIVEFCKKNECKYLDSSAFEYFIRNERFLESVVERALAINVEKSNEEYLRDKIKIAKEIANLEDVAFSYNEERLIKDIYSFVTEKVSAFYCKKLTVEQRHSVNICLNELTELKKSVDRVREKSDANYNSIIEAISDGSKLSNFKASVIVDLLSKNLIEGRFQEFDKLASIVKDRSDDVECFYECLSSILRSENCKDSIQRMISINDTYIRDTAIKTAIPILIYRNESLDCLLDIPSTGTLRIIVSSLVTGAYEGIFTEDISIDSGIEFHNITLNKKLLCEEKYLVEHIVLMQLHDKSIKNVHLVMEELEQGSKTWISRILVFDKKLESFEKDFSNASNLDELITQLQQYKNIYDGLCNTLRCFYYYVLVKAFLIAKKSNEAEKCIPSDLIIERPLSDLVLAIKIEKKEAKLEEIYEYIMQNDNTFWLLNNYFVSRKNEQELIVFCREHEDIFKNYWPIFFMYIGALKKSGNQEDCQYQLMKHSDELKQVYEYWNEVLNIDNSEKTQNAFIDACRDGNMKSMYGESLYLIIERLLNYHEFEIAEKYVAMHEKMGDKNYKIMLYKAIIQQGKKNDVEALKFFKEAFEGNPEDKNVIDSIMTLSLRNNRKVEKKVLDAALKADTSRLHMLAASCYMADGDVLRAKSENLCALLRAEEACNPAYEQFILFQTIVQNNKDVTRTCIEPDTAACYSKTGERQRWICVYKDRILPFSPYVWNNDYHVYIEDAAGLGLLRKRKGDQVEIDGEKYNVTEIVPIDVYLFRICIKQMAQAGTAKAISLQSVNGKIDVAAFNEWVVQNTPDERKAYDWLIQYNDIQEVPMPLYVYKKFTRLTYLQLVDSVLTSPDIFIRELQVPSKMNEKYIISFSALVALFKAGISVEMIKNGGGYIMESTAFQVSMDTAEIIKEYNRDTVASVGVLDGKVFLNQVDDNKKDFWIQEAGLIKKYCDSIAVVRSDSDLSNYLFDGIDSKDLFGICDYDAISYVRNNDEYSIISTEALLSSLSTSNQVMLQVCNIADWLTSQKIGAEDLLKYIKRLMDEGCLMSITKSVIVFISDAIASADESEVQRLYEIWDQLLASADFYPEQQKNVVIQALTETFSSIEEIAENVDRGILQILIKNLLLLRKQKIGIIIDEKGNLSFEIVCMDSE